MKNLLNKEFRLAVHPAAYLMPLLMALLLIPEYPYFISFMYAFISIPIIFSVCKEYKDIAFTVMLPVRKKDIVKSRVITVLVIEMIHMVLAVPFILLNNYLYPQGNAMLMDANAALLGVAFMIYAVFNVIFLPGFYRTGYKIGLPMVFSLAASLVLAVAAEFIVAAVPVLKRVFDTIDPSMMVPQIIVLLAGIAVYIVTAIVSARRAAVHFEKIDV